MERFPGRQPTGPMAARAWSSEAEEALGCKLDGTAEPIKTSCARLPLQPRVRSRAGNVRGPGGRQGGRSTSRN